MKRRTTKVPESHATQHDDRVDSLGEDGRDPLNLVHALEASDRFRRDTALGGIFHHGKISFREVSPTESLHIIIDGDRISAHIDSHSPLGISADGSARYSWARVVLHNASGAVGDLGRLVAGRRGEQRCNLSCQIERIDDLVDGDDLAGSETAPGSTMSQLPERIPFGLLDEAIHLLDTEAAPWSIQLEVGVGGHLDEEALRTALGQAMARHPMACVRTAPSRTPRRLDEWQLSTDPDLDPLEVVEYADDDAVAAARRQLQNTPVPLAQSPPLRVLLVRSPGGETLMFSISHAAMDCFAGLRFVKSVARAYTGTADPAPELGFIEARELPVRLSSTDRPGRPRLPVAVAARVRDLLKPPTRLCSEGGVDQDGYGFHHTALDQAHTAALFALRPPGSEGAVILAALHLAVDEWNAGHGIHSERIGVLMPANLRPEQWRDEMVGNFCLPARSTTSIADRMSPQAALDAVTPQILCPPQPGIGTAIVGTLGQSPLFPLLVKRVMVRLLPLTGGRIVDTATFCYLGPLPDGAGFTTGRGGESALWFSPPTRTPIGLAVGAVTVAGSLHLVFRYRLRVFGPDAGRRFATCMAEVLDRLAANPAPLDDDVSPATC